MPESKETKNVSAATQNAGDKNAKSDNPSTGAGGGKTDLRKNEEAKAVKNVPMRKTPSMLRDDPDPSGSGGDAPVPSLSDVFYEQVDSVFGGDNPNQMLTLSLLGTMLDPALYQYDLDNGVEKPAHVKANESNLVNKMFDAAKMTGGDNGRTLTAQYLSALNMLTPKINERLFDAKTKLRKVMMTPYPYDFGDGKTVTLTLEQVFYRLYSDYVDAKEAWAQEQMDKKQSLLDDFPGDSAEMNTKREDAFLDWYGIVAEARQLVVEEKLGKVLSVFSPGDMDCINGILESGVGREIIEAKNGLTNVEELSPNGGSVYPVELYPQNWVNLLDTTFTPSDLLSSPAALSQKLQTLEGQRGKIQATLNKFLALVPDSKAVDDLKHAYDDSEKAFSTALTTYQTSNINTTIDVLKTLVDIMEKNGATPDETSVKDKLTNISPSILTRILGVGDLSGVIDQIASCTADCLKYQNDLVSKAEEASKSAMEYFEAQNMKQYTDMIQPLQQQLDEINDQIKDLKEKIALATVAATPEKDAEGNEIVAGVEPNKTTDGFTQVVINAKMSQVMQKSESESSASNSSCGVSFFFGGYSSNRSHQESFSKTASEQSDMEINIGMSLAKVSIEREWFSPGVFALSADMYNTSSVHFAPPGDYTEFSTERLNEMNKCIFPCYPVAFIIAKDVTIQFYYSSGVSDSFAKSVEDHSSSGGGFFIFGGSRSSSSKSNESNSRATSTSNSVTVRFTTPQIIGYYLEATAADKSAKISDDAKGDYISIFKFVDNFQKMLEDYNKTYYGKDPQVSMMDHAHYAG